MCIRDRDGEAVGGFAFGVKKGGNHEKLITEFNKALAQMKADGTLDEIIKKWTGESQSSSNSAVPETTTPVSYTHLCSNQRQEIFYFRGNSS